MRKILGSKDKYYIQVNNAQVALFEDYFHNGKAIACGPTSYVMGLDIAGWPMDVFTTGVQPEDSVLMMVHNPVNLKKLKERRNIDYDKFPPNEVPQAYDIVSDILYGEKKPSKFVWNLNYKIIRSNIIKGWPMMMCGIFPAGGHYVTVVGFDDEKKVIIYNDPYPSQYADNNGYNREMSIDKLKSKNIFKFRIDFYPFFA